MLLGTLGEHFGNILGTVGEHFGNMLGTLEEHFVKVEPSQQLL